METRIRVRYAETDQMGVVYHANYLVWMEIGRVELCRASGVRYRDLEGAGILLTVVEVACRYLSPARYDEEVIVRTAIVKSSPRLVRFSYGMASAEDGRKLATGATTHVFCGRSLRPCRLPEPYWPLFGITAPSPSEPDSEEGSASA